MGLGVPPRVRFVQKAAKRLADNKQLASVNKSSSSSSDDRSSNDASSDDDDDDSNSSNSSDSSSNDSSSNDSSSNDSSDEGDQPAKKMKLTNDNDLSDDDNDVIFKKKASVDGAQNTYPDIAEEVCLFLQHSNLIRMLSTNGDAMCKFGQMDMWML